jgi:hypothetical protein
MSSSFPGNVVPQISKGVLEMVRNLRRSLVVFVAMALMSVTAYATEFSVVGSAQFSKPTQDPAPSGATFSAKLGLGGGVLVDFNVAQKVALSIGAIYQQIKYETKGSLLGFDFTQETKATGVHLPVAVRFWLSPMFALGIGGYFDLAMGDIKTSTTVAGTTSEDTSTYDEAQIKKTNYGALASLALRFPLGGSASFLIDGRYKLGLANLNNAPGSTTTFKMNDIQALVGVSFRMGGR